MFSIIIIFVVHVNECYNVNDFKTNTNCDIEKDFCEKFSIVDCEIFFQIVNDINYNELT